MDKIISKLAPIISKLPEPDLWPSSPSGKGKSKAVDEDSIMELQTLLSDFELLSFLDTVGIFDKVRRRWVGTALSGADVGRGTYRRI